MELCYHNFGILVTYFGSSVTFESNLGGKIHYGSSVTWKLLHFGISVTRHHVDILECMVNLEQCCRETYV